MQSAVDFLPPVSNQSSAVPIAGIVGNMAGLDLQGLAGTQVAALMRALLPPAASLCMLLSLLCLLAGAGQQHNVTGVLRMRRHCSTVR